MSGNVNLSEWTADRQQLAQGPRSATSTALHIPSDPGTALPHKFNLPTEQLLASKMAIVAIAVCTGRKRLRSGLPDWMGLLTFQNRSKMPEDWQQPHMSIT